jgi:hypothetical protein
MAEPRRIPALSAQQIDPLSWFTGPLVPISFGVLTLVYGTVMSVATWGQSSLPAVQLVGVLLCAGACLIVHAATRPLRQAIGWATGALALAVSVTGMLVSALGYAGSSFSLELWWAPGALALTMATLGPYLAVRRLLVLGSAATIVVVPLSLAIVHPTVDAWGPLGTAVLISYSPVLGIAATATFAYVVVSTMLPMLESPSRIMVAGREVRDEAAELIERGTVARLTARAVPFLEGIADAGGITPADRALAGQLARRLRDDLVTQSNLTWLDSVASESRLVVVDPDQRARRMNNAQRTALRALLRAILDTPGIDSGSLMVELRRAADGATAVGVSLDMALPEGRRILHLAPYYLTLKTAVDDLTVDSDRLLRLSFRIPEQPS